MSTSVEPHSERPNCYRVKTITDLDEIFNWLYLNGVDFWVVEVGYTGHVFQIRNNQELFKLRWL